MAAGRPDLLAVWRLMETTRDHTSRPTKEEKREHSHKNNHHAPPRFIVFIPQTIFYTNALRPKQSDLLRPSGWTPLLCPRVIISQLYSPNPEFRRWGSSSSSFLPSLRTHFVVSIIPHGHSPLGFPFSLSSYSHFSLVILNFSGATKKKKKQRT